MEELDQKEKLRLEIIDMLKTCYDPEIPVDIYELGLIYDIAFDDEKNVYIKMTLTSPACPVAGSLPGEVEQRIRTIPGVEEVTVDVVWDPPWDQSMMSDAAKLDLGFY
jgi:FeS assembly SUF system protein